MGKRYTDTNKYKKPFIRGLEGAYKLLWDYLYHDCDHAGIWIVDFDIAQIYIGNDMPVNKVDALKYFNSGEKRIIELNKGSKWFIPSFVEFQYGKLNEKNRVHNSILVILEKYKLVNNKGLIRGLEGCKDKDKDKANTNTTSKEDNLVVDSKGVVLSEDIQKRLMKSMELFKKEYPRVFNMEEPLTAQEYLKCVEKKGKDTVIKNLNAMENWKDLSKKNISAYRTLINWMK